MEYIRNIDKVCINHLRLVIINDPGLPDVVSIQKIGTEIKFFFESNISEIDLDRVIVESAEAGYFIERKIIRKQIIDERSRELLSQGFIFMDEVMSLSNESQANASSLYIDRAINIYPIQLANQDDTAVITLTNESDLSDYYNAGKNRKMMILIAGTSLKMQMESASTEAELDAIVDNRT